MNQYRRLHRCKTWFFAGLLGCLSLSPSHAQKQAITEPHQQFLDSAQALKDNDLTALMDILVPASERDTLREQWKLLREQPVTDEDRAGFEAAIGMFTKPGAEEALMQELQPMLSELGASWAQMVPMFETMVTMSIQGDEQMDPGLKQQAATIVRALGVWARNTDVTSADLARQAVAEAVRVVKTTQITTIDDLKAQDYEQLLTHGQTALGGAKNILSLYGINVNEMLETVEAQTVSQSDGTARVKYSVRFLDELMETETDMVFVDGQWIVQQALEAYEQSSGSLDQQSDQSSSESTQLAAVDDSQSASKADVDLSGLTPAAVYLGYREVLMAATSIDDIVPYWEEWMGESSAAIDSDTLSKKLTQLHTQTSEVHIVAEQLDDGVHRMDLVGQSADGRVLVGRVELRQSDGVWRIDAESWTNEPDPVSIEPVDLAVVPLDDPARPMAESATATPAKTAESAPAKASNMGSGDALSVVQQQLDRNPFLKRHKIALVAQELVDGFLTLDMSAGPNSLRRQIQQGFDVVDGDPQSLSSDSDRQAVLAINKVVKVLRKKHALEAVLVSIPE